MNKFKDINSVYKIKYIADEYIVTQINKNEEKVYIYEVTPTLLLDMSSNIQNNIISIYNQLLRLCDFNIQILVINKKFNVEEYIKNYYHYLNNISNDIFNKYILDIKEKLKKENIYESIIYLIISENLKIKSNIISYEKIIYKLEEIGCKVRKINGFKEQESILYRCINKITEEDF